MDCLNSSPLCTSRSVFSASSFEDSNNFFAAFAVLLGRFFAFAICIFAFPIYDLEITADDYLFTIIKHRRLIWREPDARSSELYHELRTPNALSDRDDYAIQNAEQCYAGHPETNHKPGSGRGKFPLRETEGRDNIPR